MQRLFSHRPQTIAQPELLPRGGSSLTALHRSAGFDDGDDDRRWYRCVLISFMQGHGDGHHHDRAAERRQDVLAASTGGEPPVATSLLSMVQTDRVVQGGEFTLEYVRRWRWI